MRTHHNRRRGNAIIEFALAFTVLVPLLFGTFQFGYDFYQYNKLAGAVRGAARFASLRSYNSTSATPPGDFTTAVKNVALYGDPAGGTVPQLSGLTAQNINLQVVMLNNVPSTVTVSVTNYGLSTVFWSWNLVNKPSATFRYTGRFAP